MSLNGACYIEFIAYMQFFLYSTVLYYCRRGVMYLYLITPIEAVTDGARE